LATSRAIDKSLSLAAAVTGAGPASQPLRPSYMLLWKYISCPAGRPFWYTCQFDVECRVLAEKFSFLLFDPVCCVKFNQFPTDPDLEFRRKENHLAHEFRRKENHAI
jgi:hypothetical protein